MTTLFNYIKLLRVKHWIKNFFVFGGLLFSLNLLNFSYLVRTVMVFLAFCLISSFVYILNDIFDRERDRAHPVKRERPLASGKISLLSAIGLAAVIICSSLSLAFMINFSTFMIILIYAVMNVFYTLYLKNKVILDVMIIAAGFVLRVLAGISAIEVPVSNWILLTTLSVSLFLGFGKRRNELLIMDENSHSHRPVLEHYSIQLLNYLIIISITLTIVTYALYSIDNQIIEKLGTDRLIFTVPFVIFGLFRYMYVIFINKGGGDPADVVLKDGFIIADVLLWILAIVGILYSKQLMIGV